MSHQVNVFPPNSRFYVVSNRHQVAEKRRFFVDPALALLWAVMTEDGLKPSPLTREENIAQVMAQSLHQRLIRKTRFPLNSEYILAELINPQEIRWVNGHLTDEQFAEVEKAGRSAAGAYKEVARSFVKSGFVAVGNHGEVRIDQTYENLAVLPRNDYQEIKVGVVRFVGPVPLNHIMSYSIDWEQLWSFLIESLIRHGPDQIPEIRNALAAILGNPAEAPRIITGDAPPGYDDCFDALIGPFNQTMSSCFMDSTLISMFGFKNSPFYQKLVVEDVNVNSKFTACSNNRQEDADMRRQIQKLLREDVEVLMSGRKRFHCTNLRNILGGRCTKGGANKDLSMGTQDPAELYSRLLEALNYTPITVRTKTYRARDEEGTDEVFINQDETNVEMLPSLRAGDETIYAAAWPFTWQTEYDELPSSDRRNALLASRPFLKTVREIVHADVIVVHIDRSVAAGEVLPGESSLESLVNPLLSLLGGNAEEYESFEGFEGFEDVEPVDPTKRNETKVNPRPVSVQLEMEVDGSVYVLKSVVYSPRDGHYAALLHCGNNWFNYDDLAAHQPISRTPMPEEEVSVLVQTRGTLLFYYPIFMRERNPALAAVPAPSLLGMSVQNSNLASATTPLQNVTLGAKK